MLHIVLFEPEIPENVGNIIRTCYAFNCKLHLIRPYGFFLNDKRIKRSSVNFLNKMKIMEYDQYQEFIDTNKISNESIIYYITRYGKYNTSKIKYNFECDNYLIFGKESTGIDKNILKANIERTIRIPISKNVRALNLSNCVAMLSFDFVRQNNFKDLENKDPFKKN
jgi:tRNA (cytidine/uridine-2'-O-)-methyltransferase